MPIVFGGKAIGNAVAVGEVATHGDGLGVGHPVPVVDAFGTTDARPLTGGNEGAGLTGGAVVDPL